LHELKITHQVGIGFGTADGRVGLIMKDSLLKDIYFDIN
jgi:hypothetical protein